MSPHLGAGATRASLTAAMDASPKHLHPVIKAVRDCGAAMVFVPQGAPPFRLPRDSNKPAIVIVGDDLHECTGPSGFHLPSIRRLIRQSCSFAVVSSAPQPDAYATMAVTAVATGKHTMIVETRPEQEIAWLALIQKLAPKRFIFLATVEGGHA
jgi:hypothetical protein